MDIVAGAYEMAYSAGRDALQDPECDRERLSPSYVNWQLDSGPITWGWR